MSAPAAKKVFIRSFGCQMNDYDSGKMADLLRQVTDKSLKALPPGVVAGLKQARGASTGK